VSLRRAEVSKSVSSGSDTDVSFDHPRALRVLGVEDNPFGRVVLNAVLTELGHQAEFIGPARRRRSGSRRAISTRC